MKRVVFFGVLIGSFVIIYNLSSSIWGLWQKRDLIVKEQNELDRQKKEKLELSRRLKEAEDKNFVEKEARDRLLMVKKEETSVVIDQNLFKSLEGSGSAKPQKDKRSNPSKWWDLFFGSS